MGYIGYAALIQTLKGQTQQETVHVGLMFDRYADVWNSYDSAVSLQGQQINKEFLSRVSSALRNQPEIDILLGGIHTRRHALAASAGGVVVTARTSGRMVIGLGGGHPLETGFLWHRTLSVPYVPGSSAKGMVRAWASPKGWGACAKEERVLELFGDTGDHGSGQLVIMDGLPSKKPKVELDVMTPHYGPYYQNPERVPPADYYDPVPVCFLTVARDQEFEWVILPRKVTSWQQNLHEGVRLFADALQAIGLGAKTAAGYGAFDRVQWKSMDAPSPASSSATSFSSPRQPASHLPKPSILLDDDLRHRLDELLSLTSEKCKNETMLGLYKEFEAEEDSNRKRQQAEVLRICWIFCGSWEGKQSAKQTEKIAAVQRVISSEVIQEKGGASSLDARGGEIE